MDVLIKEQLHERRTRDESTVEPSRREGGNRTICMNGKTRMS